MRINQWEVGRKDQGPSTVGRKGGWVGRAWYEHDGKMLGGHGRGHGRRWVPFIPPPLKP